MSHINKIADKDPCFEVDPITRAIKNISSTKTTVMQFDHNSERFTFTLPRYIEGHDMAEVTKAEVHYLNVDVPGVYPINDITVDEENESKIKCSWLISRNATMKPGALHFLLRFVCLSSEGAVEYAWHTGTHTGISVSGGMNNLADVVEDVENDITAQWKAELFKEIKEQEQTVESLQYYGDANIEPSDAELFYFTINEDNTASVSFNGETNERDEFTYEGDIVIPYEYAVGENRYTVTSISSFFKGVKIEKIIIPDSVTSIVDYAFADCFELHDIRLPKNLTKIESNMLYYCTKLISITIPDSVTSIGDYAFYGCDSLTDVYFKGTKEQWDAIEIGEYNDALLNATIHYGWSDVTKGYVDEKIGDIDAALEELHNYAQTLIDGGVV